jgi:hypothetical protein
MRPPDATVTANELGLGGSGHHLVQLPPTSQPWRRSSKNIVEVAPAGFEATTAIPILRCRLEELNSRCPHRTGTQP